MSLLLFCAALPFEARSQSDASRTVAIIDFRSEPQSREFRVLFETALKAALKDSGTRAEIVAERADPAGFEAAVSALEKRKPDVYYATTTTIARAIRAANPVVPIIFSGTADPRAAGIVTSIERPENGMTGFVTYEAVDRKRIELIAALSPRVRRVAVAVPEGYVDPAELEGQVATGSKNGITVIPLIFPPDAAPETVVDLARRQRVDLVDLPPNMYLRLNAARIIAAATTAGIPLTFRSWYYVERGGLLSYEPLEFDYAAKAASLVKRVLLGTPTSSIPVEFPSQFVLSLNLAVAERLPFAIDRDLIKRADRVYR